MQIERRFTDLSQAEFRFDEEASEQPTRIVGYAAIFNSLSEEMGRNRREIIRPGAFARSLAENRDVIAKVDHNINLGRTSSGTLRLTEDQHGLLIDLDIPDTSVGRDLVVHMRRKDINKMSFAFVKRQQNFFKDGDLVIRELIDVDLFDVSLVWSPAFGATTAELRSFDDWPQETGLAWLDMFQRQHEVELSLSL